MTFIRSLPPRDTMLAGIDAAARLPEHDRPGAVAAAIQAFAADPALLEGLDCPCCPDRYVRHLLHSDPAGGYAVVALVWRPGQMSPVHAHRTWCAFAVHQGALTETYYTQADGDLPVPAATKLLMRGEGSHGPADPALIHRLANLSCRTAISIHCYGVAFDRFGQDVNEIHAA
jgi:predicted metal-dependent enzyme (double-stranded beta helix superfamily)